MIAGREVKDGLLVLSKQRVDGIKLWQTIDKSLEEGTPVEGTIISEVKGGFMVDIGVNAFLPISQVDIKPVKNPASFIGRHLKYKVIKVNQKKANVIVSQAHAHRGRKGAEAQGVLEECQGRPGHLRLCQEHHRLRRVHRPGRR